MERVTTQVRAAKEKSEGVRAIMKYVEPLLFKYPQTKELKVDFASSDFFAIPEVLQRQNVKSKVKSSTSLQTIFSTTLKSQSLTATASVTTIISLFALYYGFLRGYWALVGIGIMSLVVVFIDLWKASLRESGKHERSAIKAY